MESQKPGFQLLTKLFLGVWILSPTIYDTFRLSSLISAGWFSYIPTFNHFLGWIIPWKLLLNNASLSSECLLTMWLKKELNLAQMTFSFPLNAVVALQYRWFSHGLIHSPIASHPFSLESFKRTFLISTNKTGWVWLLVHDDHFLLSHYLNIYKVIVSHCIMELCGAIILLKVNNYVTQ